MGRNRLTRSFVATQEFEKSVRSLVRGFNGLHTKVSKLRSQSVCPQELIAKLDKYIADYRVLSRIKRTRKEPDMRTKFLCLGLLALVFVPASLKAQTSLPAETVNVIDGSCTVTAPCTLQLYRATLASGVTICANPGDPSYNALTKIAVGTAIGTVNTSWTYADTTIVGGNTYCYYATVTFTSNSAVSPPSAFFQAIIPVDQPAAPSSITGTFSGW